MIKRAIKELCTERRLVLGGVCACFACIYALSVLGTGAGLCTPCMMDAFALASRRMTGTVGIITMLIIFAAGKDNYRADRVVRQKSFPRIWNYIVIKTGIAALFFTICVFVETLAVGRILLDELFVWNQKDSYMYFLANKTVDSIDYGMIFLTYAAECFFTIFIAALLAQLIQWYTGSGLAGVIIVAALCLQTDVAMLFAADKRNVFYGNIYDGIDVRYQFFLPAAAAVLIAVIGLMKGKRDFLMKEKQVE